MPIENERKYILSLAPDHIDDLVNEYDGIQQDIRQAYINGARIRATATHGVHGELYIFAWKKRRADGSRIEIETELSTNDFNELWEMSGKVITKQRIKIKGYGNTWDVDFLFSGGTYNGSHYLTIAEVEMPEGVDIPSDLPNFVKDNLLYLVPRSEDHKWTNPHLTDPAEVKQLLDTALKGEE